MADQIHAGAVLYAKSVGPVQAFYEAVAGFEVEDVESDHVVLRRQSFQLVILKIPAYVASSVEIESPPKRRADTPVKLVFLVASIAEARKMALEHGGALDPPELEWEFQGCHVCDGQDPEGNVVQFRQRARQQGAAAADCPAAAQSVVG